MERSGANAFVYAKASGMLGKSFTGGRASRLFRVATLADLWTKVFHTEVPLIPQMMLAQKIEMEAERQFIEDYINLVEMYDKPLPLLRSMLVFYDVENLKEMGAALCSGERERPPLVDLADYAMLNYDAWPNIQAVTAGTVFSWYDKVPDEHEQQYVHVKLDNQYVKIMWEAVNSLRGGIKGVAVDFFRGEFILSNIVWALRLKVYYNMDKGEILRHLSYAGKEATAVDLIAGPAVKMLDWRVDAWDDWQHWRYKDMLNPHDEDAWTVDPRWVENMVRQKQYKAALRLFHTEPLTELSLVAWFRIKQRECDMIRTAAEGIRLAVDSSEVAATAGF